MDPCRNPLDIGPPAISDTVPQTRYASRLPTTHCSRPSMPSVRVGIPTISDRYIRGLLTNMIGISLTPPSLYIMVHRVSEQQWTVTQWTKASWRLPQNPLLLLGSNISTQRIQPRRRGKSSARSTASSYQWFEQTACHYIVETNVGPDVLCVLLSISGQTELELCFRSRANHRLAHDCISVLVVL
jgi:hypothetical protein